MSHNNPICWRNSLLELTRKNEELGGEREPTIGRVRAHNSADVGRKSRSITRQRLLLCFFFALWLNLVYAFAGGFTAMETLLKHYETSFETLLGTQLETTTNRHSRNPTQHIGE